MNKKVEIDLPETFVRLCCEQIVNHKHFLSLIVDYNDRDPAFGYLVEKIFDVSLSHNFERDFANIEFKEFRNTMALCYLSHMRFGTYFKTGALVRELDMVLEIEKKFEEFYPPNDSRLFLLLIYVKMSYIESIKTDGEKEVYNFGDIYDLLSHFKLNRSERIDWLLVLVQSLIDIFGDKARDIIEESKGDFARLIATIEPEQREVLILKHLHYGHAINDHNYFLFNKV